MQNESGSGEVARTLTGGTLLGLIAAGVVAAWAWAGDRPECGEVVLGCLAEGLVVAVIGIPAALTLAWLSLRALGASDPALAVALTFLVALVIPPVIEPAIDPPLWAWPFGFGAVGCLVIALLGARSR
jgi:hypothetical protein